jgi:hypothetical protein
MYAGEGVSSRACKRHGRVCEACGPGEPVRRRDVETDGRPLSAKSGLCDLEADGRPGPEHCCILDLGVA